MSRASEPRAYNPATSDPETFWEAVVDLEYQSRYDRFLSYLSLVLLFYWGPSVVSFLAGTVVGADAAKVGAAMPLESLVIGIGSNWQALFVHNLVIVLFIVGGVLTLGIVTASLLMLNGIFIGYGFGYLVGAHGWTAAVLAVIAHGVFELPALWLAGVASFRALHLFALVTPTGSRVLGTSDPLAAIEVADIAEVLVLFAASILLLFVAAIVEVTITPDLIKYVL